MTNSPLGQRPPDRFPVSGPADILAYIPHSLGFTPQDSLVLMTVDSARLGATLRLDLPASSLDYSEFAAKVSDILRSDVSANGVLMALYTDHGWKRPGSPPYRRLIQQLNRCLTGKGLPIRDGWVVSATAWREYFCTDSSCCPWPGRPLQEITNSTLSAEMVYRGSAYAATLDQAVALDLPDPWGKPGEPAAAHSEAYRCRLEGQWCGASQFAGTLNVWESVFSAAGSGHPKTDPGFPPLRTDPETAGFLLASLRARPVRDTLLVMAALGREQALAGAGACQLLSVDGLHPLLPPAHRDAAWVTNSIPGPSATGPVLNRPLDAARNFRDVLVGQYPQAPHWDSMDAAFTVFAELLAADAADEKADREASSALLSLMSWIEWARGRGSRAQIFLTRCLDSHPGYRLAELLEELLATGVFPAWATNPGTAWKGAERYPGVART